MAQIFLSYARADQPSAQAIAAHLGAEGFSIWWDHEISSGERWDKTIKRELDAAACVIVLWTANSVDTDATVKSEWVANEASEGKRRNVLVPVLLPGGRLPFEFQRIQAADLSHWRGDRGDPAWQALASRLFTLCGTGQGAVKPPEVMGSIGHGQMGGGAQVFAATGTGKVILRREARFSGSMRGLGVYLDGAKVGEVANDGELVLEVTAGPHHLQTRQDLAKSPEVSFDLRPSETIRFCTAMPKGTDLLGTLSFKLQLARE